jgi:uncharacterized membrane protein
MRTIVFDWLIGDMSIFGVGIQHWMLVVIFVIVVSFVFSKVCEQRIRG